MLALTPNMDYQSPNAHLDEEEIRNSLFVPLERFLCGCSGGAEDEGKGKDTQEVFKELAALNDPQSLCGKLFRMGEPTYTCKDCGHDPTCVLCVDCFKKSEHRNHRLDH